MITAGRASRCPREVPPSRPALVNLGDALDAAAAPVLRERLIGELRRGPALLVLDLSHVSSCDVVGLAVLIGTQRRARQLGVSVRLAAPSPAAANALRSTGLEHSFTISQDTGTGCSPRVWTGQQIPLRSPAGPAAGKATRHPEASAEDGLGLWHRPGITLAGAVWRLARSGGCRGRFLAR